MEAGERLWYNTNSQTELGFAAPVEKLLGRLGEWQQQRETYDANGSMCKA